jgi:hypothetical protein
MLLGALCLTGCITGDRPSFGESAAAAGPSGVAEVDAVLSRLDAVSKSQFSADYNVLTRLGNRSSTASVVQVSPARRSITVNSVRFIFNNGSVSTCNLTTATCEPNVNDARISDVSLTHDFYGSSFAQRLRVDADRRVGAVKGYTITQADRQATCVDVPVVGGTKTYCALDNGVLARYDGNDLLIEMTAISDTPDESKFATS